MWITFICLHAFLVSSSLATGHHHAIINGRNWQEYVSEPSALHYQLPDEILNRFKMAYNGDPEDLEQIKLWLKVDSTGSSKFLFKELIQLSEDNSDQCEWSLINFARTLLPKLEEDQHSSSPVTVYFRHYGKEKFGKCARRFAREFHHQDKYIFEWIMDKFMKAAFRLGKEAGDDKLYDSARNYIPVTLLDHEATVYKVASGFERLSRRDLSNSMQSILQGEEAVVGMYTKWKLNRAISQPPPQNLDKNKCLSDFFSDICATMPSEYYDGLDTFNLASVLGFKSNELAQKRLLKLNEYSRICLGWFSKHN